jgi:hypothetical protein
MERPLELFLAVGFGRCQAQGEGVNAVTNRGR